MTEVIVIGAGAAGLTAARDLARAGVSLTVLEARDRIGGRMYSLRDVDLPVAVEMGAEFMHGVAPELVELVRSV
jgi:monoamine oxidase